MPRLTLTRPNRLNLRGLIFDRDVATEVPIDVFRELYDTRKAQFDFSAEGIALMVAASADPDPAPRADASPTEVGPAVADPQVPKTGLIIRKSRRAKRDEPETPDAPDLFDPDPADPAEPEPAETGVDV